jgi:hypothetical protein
MSKEPALAETGLAKADRFGGFASRQVGGNSIGSCSRTAPGFKLRLPALYFNEASSTRNVVASELSVVERN